MLCLICGKEFNKGIGSHLRNVHKISSEKYYKQFYPSVKCTICNKDTPFISLSKGYAKTCSVHCARVLGSRKTKEKYGYIPGSYGSVEHKQFMLDKYGVDNAQKDLSIRAKTIETTMNKYNVKYTFLSEDAKQKAKVNSHSTEVKQKISKTCLERYGETNPAKSIEVKKKSRDTVLEKHKIDFSQDRLDLSLRELNSIGTKIEQLFYNSLDNFTLLYNVSSDQYPYLCDFYIKELDLYVELNITWTHGWHYYDKEKDKYRLQKMINKNNGYYDNAIHTWTITDINKRDCAIRNNLNYAVVWNIEQMNNLIAQINSDPPIGFNDYNVIKTI